MPAQSLRSISYLAVFALIILLGFTSQKAVAHAELTHQEPKADALISPSPADIFLKFSEAIELKFTKVTITGSDKKVINLDKITLDPQDKTRLIAAITQPLVAGKYTVNWQVVSVDGHKTKGHYNFIVAPN